MCEDAAMSALRVVFGDQLSHDIAALKDMDRLADRVLMMEVISENTQAPHHKQKIVLVLSAMRHFAEELRQSGVQVDYVSLEDEDNTGSLTGELERAVARGAPSRVILTSPSEWRVRNEVRQWADACAVNVEVREDDRFFASHARFAAWAKGRCGWRMETFYREMRREHDVLMDANEPAGGQWNYDPDNRKRLPPRIVPPSRRRFEPDATTREVMALVERRFSNHFGRLDAFGWPVTRSDALAALDDFITHALPSFGDYQDAMKAGAPFLFHALLAPAMNYGLLGPREVCRAAEQAWRAGQAPLNAVEGFIRQILGWREYVRGVYQTLMPDYAHSNALQATRRLPDLYWTGRTDLRCLSETISATAEYAYAHHIQRLMITGNFALLAGVRPDEIERWYLIVYADALEWVEMPNTLGMAVYADGGQMASKPYAASGAYIDKMSDYCAGCAFDVKQKTGPKACPFNYLYWAFLIRQQPRLGGNPRLAMPYRTLQNWSAERKADIVAEAQAFLDGLDVSPSPS